MQGVTRFLVFAAAVCVASQSNTIAQPVLTPENTVLPLLGQSIIYDEYSATSPGDVGTLLTEMGEDKVWNISSSDFGPALTLPVEYREAPFTGLPGADVAHFQDATHAFIIEDIVSEELPEPVELINYSRIEDSQLLNFGFAGRVDADEDGDLEEVAVTFDPADVEMIFPLTMGSQWMSETSQTFNVVGLGSFPGGTVSTTSEVVGWGTLVTPSGLAEVLQIMDDVVISSFGIVTIEFRTIRFIGPLQQTAGKSALQGMFAAVELEEDGSVSDVTYTVFEADGGASTAAEDVAELPSGIRLDPSYPNPFNPTTTIPFSVENSGSAVITIHDMLGRQVDVILDGVVAAGAHTVAWDAAGHPSGMYHVRLSVDGQVRARTVVLQK
ncbi:MAG TPA: T9SS type A sorting domain-containing protein [Rhodothermales bacterium]|nr:T9SS type A sorting domain-containing protein [Rhodothermales bacterium]